MKDLSPMTKAPTPTEKKSRKQRNNPKTPPKTSIIQRLRTDLGQSIDWSNSSQPTGVIKPVNGILTFTLTTKAV